MKLTLRLIPVKIKEIERANNHCHPSYWNDFVVFYKK